MAEKMPQTYENHVRFVPLYHFVAGPIFLLNFLWSLYRMITGFSVDSVIGVAVAVALIVLFFFARVFALGAQDRVIRLEERLRMQAVLPDDLKPRINDYTTDQLLALRFASDAELPELARKILDENVGDRKSIKELVKAWRPDYQRV